MVHCKVANVYQAITWLTVSCSPLPLPQSLPASWESIGLLSISLGKLQICKMSFPPSAYRFYTILKSNHQIETICNVFLTVKEYILTTEKMKIETTPAPTTQIPTANIALWGGKWDWIKLYTQPLSFLVFVVLISDILSNFSCHQILF
jgi:hypothetical protein